MSKKTSKSKRNGLLLAFGLFIASVIYVFSQYLGNAQATATNVGSTSIQTPSSQTTTAPSNTGLYADGTYTGSAANAYYGTVQVEATVQNGKLTNVQFLQYPSDRSTSRMINGQAMPQLISEAIAAQGSNVNIVSGASDTSQAFQQSLHAALVQAQG